jgi:hypothetical protein
VGSKQDQTIIRGLSGKVIVRVRSGFGRRRGREKQGASKLYLSDWVCAVQLQAKTRQLLGM